MINSFLSIYLIAHKENQNASTIFIIVKKYIISTKQQMISLDYDVYKTKHQLYSTLTVSINWIPRISSFSQALDNHILFKVMICYEWNLGWYSTLERFDTWLFVYFIKADKDSVIVSKIPGIVGIFILFAIKDWNFEKPLYQVCAGITVEEEVWCVIEKMNDYMKILKRLELNVSIWLL